MSFKRVTAAAATLAIAATLALPSAASAKTFRIKADWGYLQVQEIKAPKKNKCKSLRVVMDVRNASRLPPSLAVAIQDEFGNIVGYNEKTTVDLTSANMRISNGKYKKKIRVCAKDHYFYYNPGNPDAARVPLSPYTKGSDYDFVACKQSSGVLSECIGTEYDFK